MPSTITKARMIPASEQDVINPGSFYLACLNLQRKTEPESYWIVLRAPREWLPVGFFDTRPVTARSFPFWIVGKHQRVWLPRSSLYYLDQSQRDIFINRQTKAEFSNCLAHVTSFRDPEAVLSHFSREIAESTARYNERRERVERTQAAQRRSRSLSSFMDDYVADTPHAPIQAEKAEASTAVIIRDDNPTPKRQRREDKSLTHTIPDADCSIIAETEAVVKTEQEERHFTMAGNILNDSRVRVYVGRSNKEYPTDAAVLQRSSSILHSLISTNDEDGKFIMHPKLRDVDADDFLSMLEFMQTGKYQPALGRNSDGNEAGSTGSDGNQTTEIHSESLVQAARLYILAKSFRVKGMSEHLVRKVTQAQYKRYSNIALIEFGRIVLTRAQSNNREQAGRGLPGNFTLEVIDQWAIAQLADNFMQIMRSEIEHSKYLELIEATAERKMHAAILERAALNYRRLGGLPVVIEDDE